MSQLCLTMNIGQQPFKRCAHPLSSASATFSWAHFDFKGIDTQAHSLMHSIWQNTIFKRWILNCWITQQPNRCAANTQIQFQLCKISIASQTECPRWTNSISVMFNVYHASTICWLHLYWMLQTQMFDFRECLVQYWCERRFNGVSLMI